MILPIYVYGQPVLREVAKPVDLDMEGLDQLIADMYETMKNADGVGIAAPQVGKSLRIVIVEALTSLMIIQNSRISREL